MFSILGYAAIQRFINEITTSNNIDKLNDPQLMTEEDIEKLKSLKTTIEDLDLSNEICFLGGYSLILQNFDVGVGFTRLDMKNRRKLYT